MKKFRVVRKETGKVTEVMTRPIPWPRAWRLASRLNDGLREGPLYGDEPVFECEEVTS